MPKVPKSVQEIQRMANILPINLQHRVTQDVSVNGYHLQKGTVVIPQIAAVHMDPKIFPNQIRSIHPAILVYIVQK